MRWPDTPPRHIPIHARFFFGESACIKKPNLLERMAFNTTSTEVLPARDVLCQRIVGHGRLASDGRLRNWNWEDEVREHGIRLGGAKSSLCARIGWRGFLSSRRDVTALAPAHFLLKKFPECRAFFCEFTFCSNEWNPSWLRQFFSPEWAEGGFGREMCVRARTRARPLLQVINPPTKDL